MSVLSLFLSTVTPPLYFAGQIPPFILRFSCVPPPEGGAFFFQFLVIFLKNLGKKRERSKPFLLEMGGDIEGKAGKLDEPHREAARPLFLHFFTAGEKFRPPLYILLFSLISINTIPNFSEKYYRFSKNYVFEEKNRKN